MFKSFIEWVILTIGKIHWPSSTYISVDEQAKIREMLVNDYYVILTYRKNHLSTFFVGLSHFILTGKWGRWSHALMNTEDAVKFDKDFRIVSMTRPLVLSHNERALVEAIGTGTQVTPFEKVFDVHAAALLVPKGVTIDEWRGLVDTMRAQLGKPYDTLFNIADENSLSCVELVRMVLRRLPDYETRFASFEALIKKHKNLTPQMFYDCSDFEKVYEVRV